MFPLCPFLHWIVQTNLNDDVHEIVDSAIVSMYRKLLACMKHYICFKVLQITMYTELYPKTLLTAGVQTVMPNV